MEKKIKLFVDAHSFDKEYQGVRTFIKEIYTVFLARYPSLEIFFGAVNADKLREEFPLINPENIIQYKNRANLVRFYSDIPSILKHYQIEFAHFQYLAPVGKKNCIYIVTTHDILFNDFRSDFSSAYRYTRNYFFRRGIDRADIKTTVSEYSKDRIQYYFKIPATSLHVIPNGVNGAFAKRFSSQQAASDLIFTKYGIKNYILYVSRIEPRKNHIALIKAYIEEKLYDQEVALVLIGKESIMVTELALFLDQLSVDQKRHIHWISQVDQQHLEAFYKGCRVFAYPSKAEGFGIPPLEAAVAKVPVVCSDQTAMRDFDFFAPYLFNPYDLADLRDKLRRSLENPPELSQLNRIAEEVLIRYSWENSAEKLFQLITSYRKAQ